MTLDSLISSFAQKETKRFKLKVGVLLFLIRDDHLLLSRRYNTGIDDGKYVVPMGGLKEGETATTALIREAQEETNLILTPENIHVCHVMHRLHQMPDGYTFPQMDLFFKVNHYEGLLQNMEPHKCDELKFYPIKQLPEETVPFIRYALDCFQQGMTYSEFGWE